MFLGRARPRSAFRRAFLRGGVVHRDLLPADLPGASPQAREHAFLYERRGGGRRGLPPLPEMPPGAGAGDRVGRCGEPTGGSGARGYGGTRAVEFRRCRPRGLPRGERPASAPHHRIGTRRVAHRTRPDAAPVAGEAPAGRNLAEPDRDCLRQRFRQRAAFQRAVQGTLQLESAGSARPADHRWWTAVPVGLPPAHGLGQFADVPAAAGGSGSGNGRCHALSAHGRDRFPTRVGLRYLLRRPARR